jgi:hypothetical protein
LSRQPQLAMAAVIMVCALGAVVYPLRLLRTGAYREA